MTITLDNIIKEISNTVDSLDNLDKDISSMDNTHTLAAMIILIKKVEIISRRIDILKEYIINKEKELGGEETGGSV